MTKTREVLEVKELATGSVYPERELLLRIRECPAALKDRHFNALASGFTNYAELLNPYAQVSFKSFTETRKVGWDESRDGMRKDGPIYRDFDCLSVAARSDLTEDPFGAWAKFDLTRDYELKSEYKDGPPPITIRYLKEVLTGERKDIPGETRIDLARAVLGQIIFLHTRPFVRNGFGPSVTREEEELVDKFFDLAKSAGDLEARAREFNQIRFEAMETFKQFSKLANKYVQDIRMSSSSADLKRIVDSFSSAMERFSDSLYLYPKDPELNFERLYRSYTGRPVEVEGGSLTIPEAIDAISKAIEKDREDKGRGGRFDYRVDNRSTNSVHLESAVFVENGGVLPVSRTEGEKRGRDDYLIYDHVPPEAAAVRVSFHDPRGKSLSKDPEVGFYLEITVGTGVITEEQEKAIMDTFFAEKQGETPGWVEGLGFSSLDAVRRSIRGVLTKFREGEKFHNQVVITMEKKVSETKKRANAHFGKIAF